LSNKKKKNIYIQPKFSSPHLTLPNLCIALKEQENIFKFFFFFQEKAAGSDPTGAADPAEGRDAT
jgi:hypothetical protein